MQQKKLLLLITGIIFTLINSVLFCHTVLAGNIEGGLKCQREKGDVCCNPPIGTCDPQKSYACQPTYDKSGKLMINTNDGTILYTCQEASPVVKAFGFIIAPPIISGFLQRNPTGAGAISQFLSNAINLIYVVATIVLVFMIIWGAFEWLVSGGDKEKLAAAQKRILNAVIGIILLAVAFAVIRIIGVFTGFTFFKGA